jgi:molybdate transport system substrate-binding protein
VRRAPTWLAIVALAAALAGCGHSDASSGGSGGGSAAASKTLTVFAASSLTGAFQELGKQFEAAHQGVKVQFSFGGSSDLVAQIQQGAPADVFASADQANMDKLTGGGLVGSPKLFATNTLEIAVPPDNPAGIRTLQDLTKKGVNLVVCAPEVPCGAAAQQVAHNAGLTLRPVSEEQSVTDVLSKVEAGEADAGLVYVTDVQAAGSAVRGIPFRESKKVVNVYPVATVKGSKQQDLGNQFVRLVTGADGRTVLHDFGFGAP